MKILTLNYDTGLLKSIKDRRIVVYLDSLDSLMYKYAEAKRNNDVLALVVSLPYASISQIEFKEEWSQIPLIIKTHNIGDYNLFLYKVNDIRHLNIRIYLSSKSQNVFTDLKIMSSVGVDCGIFLEDDVTIEDDKLLDLASYYFMSPSRHATIEPFEFILRHLRDERNENFRNVYFNNILIYKNIESADDLVIEDTEENDFDLKMQFYYKHFMDLDECSKCPAFKICDHQMSTKLKTCKTTMNEIFEYAEIKNDMNNNQSSPKTICQL